MEDTIIILNKVTAPHHQCDKCDMFVTWETFTIGQLGPIMCRRGTEKNHRRLDVNATWVATGKEFQAHDHIIVKVDTFKHLGRMLYFDERDWPAVVGNLQRSRRKWVRLS